ncbi:hypothetical protein HU200_025196 [Digitaria exilis]|uniref:G-patch domain-containing protein n=1 Tax=Digitaria exilis TaxID=1010633 RepID=A0A835CAX8_9POAL|nr:hypothetical protein HU200_025196 [Digitaria exilis]CAB3501396.1 unnamed protein product [Digitaria exilis]
MEEKKKLSFPITNSQRRPSKPISLSTLAYGDLISSALTGRRHFVTEFDPSQPLSPAAAAPVAVIPPIPNSGCFGHRNPSSLPTPARLLPAAARTFVLDTSTGTGDNSYGYGLNLRAAADDDVEAGLHGMSMEGFAAAVLAGYGWSKGKCVGKSHRNKPEETSMAVDRRRGGRPAFGYNPTADDPRKSRSGDWTWTAGADDKNHIRVRVVSEKLGKRLYLMKGKVVDVAAAPAAACDVVMEDGLELVQGVGQDMLETVLPRRNGRVLVLYGKHRGVCGRLVEKNPERETGLVEDADTKAVVRVRYDQMAEYTGDVELLGY